MVFCLETNFTEFDAYFKMTYLEAERRAWRAYLQARLKTPGDRRPANMGTHAFELAFRLGWECALQGVKDGVK